MSQYSRWPVISSGSGGVSSLNGETGALTLVAGSGITITPSGGNITIASTGSGGTVTSVSVVSANGLAGTVANSTTTPAITLSTTITGILQGNGTAISAATTTGTGNVVLASSPSLTSPALDTPTSITLTNAVGLPLTTGVTGILSIANGGTGQSTAAAAYNVLSPMTTAGDIEYELSANTAARLSIGTTGQVLTVVSGLPSWQTVGGTGTVTSVALTTPGVLYSVAGSPITTSGTLALNLITQTANTVLAGPTSGGSANPSFRTLVSADIPNNAANTTGTASNITATSNSTLTTLSSLLLPGTQVNGFTSGSIIFAGSTGALSQDNANFFWNDTNLALGIGTIPGSSVSIDLVNITGASKAIQTTGYGTGSTIPFRGRFARGTLVTPAAAQSGDLLSVFSGRGYGTSQFATTSTGAINIIANETFTNTSNATYLQFEVTPTGSVTIAEAMRINSTGNILIGTTTDTGQKFQVNGSSIFSGTVTDSTAPIFSSLTGYLYANGSSALTAATTIPFTAISGVATIAQTTISTQVISGTNVIDWSLGSVFTQTLSANTTFTFSNNISGQTIVVRLTNTASNFTVTWPTVKWPNQTTPTMTVGAFSDVYTFIYDGSNIYGSYIQNF